MTLQINKQIEIFEDFLTQLQFETLMDNIKKIEDKFKMFQNQYYSYQRIFLNDFFTDNPIQILTRNILSDIGYDNKNLDITITSYNTSQKYDWHDDNTENRTYNYILYLTNQEWFKGGELQVKVNGKIQTIIPKKNTLIVMDSKLEHRVLAVQTKIGGIWQMSRLTLNGHIKQ